MCVYLVEICVYVCVSRRDSIMMPRHYVVRIIIPIRILIRFMKVRCRFMQTNHKIIGQLYSARCN